MNGTYKISGGRPLSGTVVPIPNKNSLMGALPLAVVGGRTLTVPDLPRTSDVAGFLSIFEEIGVEIHRSGNLTSFDASGLRAHEVQSGRAKTFRGSFSLAGPLLARERRARIPVPGGCKLGVRSVATHVNAFRELGIEVSEDGEFVSLAVPRGWGGDRLVWLSEASVTATINVASFAAGMEAGVEIRDAACEPHVVDVLNALKRMGAEIEGIGSNRLFVRGTSTPNPITFEPTPDFVDVSGYCVAAAVTGGRIRVAGGNTGDSMRGIVRWMRYFGLDVTIEHEDVIADGSGPLELQYDQFPHAGHDLPKLAVRPWPGFPVDVLPVMVTLATKTAGRILFQNWMYESGFDFIRELIYMGAEIYMSDPQKIIVMEPVTSYVGGVVGSPGIIQGTKAIFLAALSDPVETVIHGTDILKRRYPNILETYRRLGACIEEGVFWGAPEAGKIAAAAAPTG